VAFVFILLLASCGGGSEDEHPHERVSISITEISYPHAWLLFQPEWWSAYDEVAIGGDASRGDLSITWTNSAGGSGQVAPTAKSCIDPIFNFTYQCGWEWVVFAPLVVGVNQITIVATSPHGSTAVVSVTVTKPRNPLERPTWS